MDIVQNLLLKGVGRQKNSEGWDGYGSYTITI